MQPDGQTLWADFCARPDESTFEPIYDKFKPLVWTICRRMLGHDDDAGDAFQSAWARLFAHAKSEGMRAAADPVERLIYVFSIREADALKKRRARHGRREIAMDELPQVASGAVPADQAAAAAERRTKLETVVAMLPEKYRLPIQLHYLHGMTQAQIAAMMDMPRATVAARLSRGLRKLTPLAERAGLGEVAGLLGAVAVGGALLAPPKAFAAAAVFAQVQAMLAAGVTSAGLATSAAITKSILGASIMKAKLALVCSGMMLVAAVTVAGVYYQAHHATQSQLASKSAQVAQTDTVTASSAKSAPSMSANMNAAKAASLVESAPSPTPTPVATPAGPMRKIQFAVVWADTLAAADATTVSIQQGIDSSEFPVASRTNKGGTVTLEIPEAWASTRARAQNPDSINIYQAINPATVQQPITLKLVRAGRIYGSVLTPDNRPVAGATIQCQGVGAMRVTRSNQDGSFEVCSVPAGAAKITATFQSLRSDMKEPGGKAVTSVVGKRTGPIVLTMEPGLTLSGVVTESKTGKPIVGATIGTTSGIIRPKATTDLAGHYQLGGLAPGRTTIAARAENFAGQSRIVQPTPDAEARCDFALDPGGEIELSLVNEKDEPVEGATVSASGQSMRYIDNLKSDTAGRVLVRNVPTSEKVNISASKTGTGTAYDGVEFPAGKMKTTAKLVLKPEKKEIGYIQGTVTDESAKPLPNITVYHGYLGSSTQLVQTKTDAAGHYLLEATQVSGAQLTAAGDGWGTEFKFSVVPGTKEQPVIADFIMKPGHWLAGLVVDEKDKPIEGVSLGLRAESPSGDLPYRDLKTDATGRFRVEGLPDQKIDVSTRIENLSSQSDQFDVDQEIKIVLHPAGEIRGCVLDATTRKPVDSFAIKVSGNGIMYDRTKISQAFSSPEGKFKLDSLRKDESYRLTIEAKGYTTKYTERDIVAVVAGAGDEITILMSKGGSLRGYLFDSKTNEPIAGATVVYATQMYDHFLWSQVTDLSDNGIIRIAARAGTGLDGRFELTIDDENRTLYIVPPDHMRMIIPASERKKYLNGDELAIPVPRGGQIRGRAFLAGNPQPKARVTVSLEKSSQSDGRANLPEMIADDQGAFGIDGLEPGRYAVMGPMQHYQNYGYGAYSREIELKENETKEVNLGDNPGGSLLCGAVMNQGVPVPGARISLTPAFPSDYTSIDGNSDDHGVYAIDGLVPGKYNADVYTVIGDSNDFRIRETVEVGNGTVKHDFEKGGHKITARLVFDQSVPDTARANYRSAGLIVHDIRNIMNGPTDERIDQTAKCEVKAGTITFSGKFKGDYDLMLICDGKPQSIEVALPRVFTLNNLEADQDLGEIVVPATGRLKLSVKLPPNTNFDLGTLSLGVMPAGDPNAFSLILVDPKKTEQSVGPVNAGPTEIVFIARGYKCVPPRATINIAAGAEAGPLAFEVVPATGIRIYAIDASGQKAVSHAKVTLNGAGQQRTLESTDAPMTQRAISLLSTEEKDGAFGPMFSFTNLTAGTYTVTIEAPGYQPETKTINLPAGKTESIQTRMQPVK